MSAVTRLFSRTLLRPGPSLLVLGAAILASNWVWYGSGLFLGFVVGLALTIAGLLGVGYAAYCLARGRCQLQGLSIFIVAAVLLPAVALIALRWRSGAPLLMHDGAYQTEEAIKFLLAGHDPYGVDYSQTSMRLWHWYVNQPLDSSLFHYVYSPLTFLVGLPFSLVAKVLSIPFDFRIVLILAALAGLGAGQAAAGRARVWGRVRLQAIRALLPAMRRGCALASFRAGHRSSPPVRHHRRGAARAGGDHDGPLSPLERARLLD